MRGCVAGASLASLSSKFELSGLFTCNKVQNRCVMRGATRHSPGEIQGIVIHLCVKACRNDISYNCKTDLFDYRFI
jgi:hypothetical protein